MNTLDIFKFLINDKYCNKYFLGVYARDELPTQFKKRPCMFIANTDSRNETGTHWLAFYFDENKNAEFFDSYGLAPTYYGLSEYLNETSNSWNYNSKRIQSFFSEYCGQICLFYCYFKSRNFSLNYIQSIFSNDYEKNEKIILKFLNI